MADITLNETVIAEMAKVGVMYGHKKSKTHPRMKPYIVGNRNEIELIDPEATLLGLEKAIEFLKEKIQKNGIILVVGSAPAARETVLSFAGTFNLPYVVNRWLGGTLTNFQAIEKRVQYYQGLRVKQERGELSKYTKKEQSKFNEEIGKMSESFDGLLKLNRLPDAILVVDIAAHETAVREGKKLKIPIVAILDTDDNLDLVEYPILANDHAKMSIEWIFAKLQEGIKAGGNSPDLVEDPR